MLLLCLSDNLIRYLWISLLATIYVVTSNTVVLVLFLTPLAINHLYGQTSNTMLMVATKPLYASLLMLSISNQLTILLAVLVAFKVLPESGLQWFNEKIVLHLLWG